MIGPLRVGAATHVGLVRTSNEDCLLVGRRVFAVADGMGGHAAGEVASAMAVDALRGLDEVDEPRPEHIRAVLVAANDAIRDAADADPDRAGMGTTATGLVLTGFNGSPHWAVFNIGDSRVYRHVGGGLVPLTADHTEAAALVASGAMTAEQARTARQRNVITRALGARVAPEPDQWVFPPEPGERFLVCSDGLTNELPDQEIADILDALPDAKEAATTLVRRAVLAGGRDNVTVVVVDHDEP
ncbi:protein phosphatase 2C domain-containing protein [Saccharothrix violaceirubra]|uniref:Protein phosphatase n=1 Tax=Saccharothrix violaceirubra TaxID=413306 RepID=A0A7W7WXB0_9PSEU|nr:protein phosphatase 2C domain-containing protein [Saccharothrix violaceirubra]MBB4967205.1 protein phosphatase [Saccharothrix violaceirubra]